MLAAAQTTIATTIKANSRAKFDRTAKIISRACMLAAIDWVL
jgi:azurin